VPSGKIILVGAGGLLGGTFARVLPNGQTISLGRADLDPGDPDATMCRIVDLRPSLVINCAADTDVEGAEAAPERAFAVNATMAGALARGAAASGAGMLHFSSTGCYGDWKTVPYDENDPLRPTTAHHRSKAAGEELVLRADPGALVMRLGWLFGGLPGQRKNFVWARLMEARGKSEIGSNPSQIGCPTAADDVVTQALMLSRAGIGGVFNCVGGGPPASRLDYVAAILDAGGSATRAVPVVFPRRAPVSPNEAAVNTRLGELGLDQMTPWRVSLTTYVRSLPAGAASD
jgi:dTDP-4-dehydrorhamnose reductase